MLKTAKYIILLPVFIVASCYDEDLSNISDNVLVRQDLSIPLGPRVLDFSAPALKDTNNIPGLFGSFYYNGYKYPLSRETYSRKDYVDFNISSSKNATWIKHLTLRIIIGNSFPTDVKVQFYLNQNNTISDSVFVSGPMLIKAASVNSEGIATEPTIQVFDIPFDGEKLTRLKNSELLVSSIHVNMINPLVYPIRLSAQNFVQINLSAEIILEYNIQDVNK